MRRVGLPEPHKLTDAQKQMGVMPSPEWEPAQALNLGKSSTGRHHRFIGGTFDRGAGIYQDERFRHKRPSLVETGRHAGRSRVRFSNQEVLLFHQWTKDFFISAINTPLYKLVVIICVIYIATFFFFSAFWWIIVVSDSTCLYNTAGGLTYVEIFMFSFITQQTIGYGNTGPNSCWGAAWLIIIQTLVGMIMDAITIGIIFARISHPKNRGRSIAISDSACIARRDGILKFMFRIADLRSTQVVEPKVKAYLYTWGAGRTTAEGEHIPVRIEELDIGYIDAMLILPLIIEHTIDERSPLCGHTHDSLMAVAAEIIVTFEGTTEFGNPFMARQSYLPSEVHWGHEFKRIIIPPKPNDTRYMVDVAQFHEVEAHAAIKADTPSKTSRLVVSNALRTVPFPLLGENTLVLSDHMCLAPDENGHMSIMFRVGDTYGGNQFVDVSVRAYVYRWRPPQKGICGIPDDFEVKLLETGYSTGEDHLFLWLPVVCKHVIDDVSPLRSWLTPGGFERDHSSAIAVVVEGWMYSNSQERMRLRIYNVKNSVRPGHGFAPMVTPPHETPELKPRIDWSKFHHIRPLTAAAAKQDAKIAAQRQGSLQFPGMDDRPLVVPVGVTGMLGEAVSEPSFHGDRQSSPGVPEPPVQQDAPDLDPTAHTHTWDSARASNHHPLPNSGPVPTPRHAASLAPGPASQGAAVEHREHNGSLNPEPAITSPFAAQNSSPFHEEATESSLMRLSRDTVPHNAARRYLHIQEADPGPATSYFPAD
ncbi:hypothetical protein WJX84_003016 [Apatococcus fuscideae]|uniref:Uncharacterized protein n=1 Tax=Apatococcus fuscideae TaxID=2026836 RepID=A0AAW1SUN8_9CHLO